MGDWQQEAAQLRALMLSAKSREDREPRLLTLRRDVNAARSKVDTIVTDLPDRLKRHSRVQDILSALERLERAIEDLK
jgi:hypothetical protein